MRRTWLSLRTVAILTLLACAAGATTLDTTDQINILGLPYSPKAAFQFHMTSGGNFNLLLGNNLGIINDKGSGTGLFFTAYPKLQTVSICYEGAPDKCSGTQVNGITGTPVGTCTNTSGATCTFDLTQTAPLLFEYGIGGGLLTANLDLESITETNLTGGGVNEALQVNLTNFSGSFASDFSNNGVLQLVLLFTIKTPGVYSLVGVPPGREISAMITSGQVNPLLAPSVAEPASLALLGAGLLGLGVFLRKRMAMR